jgi:hypothetical protein
MAEISHFPFNCTAYDDFSKFSWLLVGQLGQRRSC